MKKKDQRYQRIGQGDLETNGTRSNNQPYRDEPSDSGGNTDGDGPSSSTPLRRPLSSPGSANGLENRGLPDSTSSAIESHNPEQQNVKNDDNAHRKQLRLRRNPNSNMSPPSSRSGSMRSLPMSPLSREGSAEKLVILEGDIGSSLERLNGKASKNGSFSSIPRSSSRIKRSKNSNDEADSSASEGEEEGGKRGEGAGSSGEDDDDLMFTGSHGSSFDLLDEEDEINLQRYSRDFGASPFASNYREGDLRLDDESRTGMDNSFNMYHPRSDTEGSNSKDPWIRMVQQNDQQSPTNGNTAFSSIKSMADLLLFLQGVRRQARQRRAQRMLTMHSERWTQRAQFWFMTYCWDVTDVGLLVIAISFCVWFFGLLMLGRAKARRVGAGASSNENQSGAEYNGNAEFTDYEKSAGSSLYLLFQWLWWALGFVLLLRILGPFTVYNVNNRRRERRRQRFMSGSMDVQQRRMQQQQLPTIVAAAYSYDEDAEAQEVSDTGLEITETKSSPYADEVPALVEEMNIT